MPICAEAPGVDALPPTASTLLSSANTSCARVSVQPGGLTLAGVINLHRWTFI